ncbi:hypothetical protein GCM10009626_41830 [Brachybacterium sacelli]
MGEGPACFCLANGPNALPETPEPPGPSDGPGELADVVAASPGSPWPEGEVAGWSPPSARDRPCGLRPGALLDSSSSPTTNPLHPTNHASRDADEITSISASVFLPF